MFVAFIVWWFFRHFSPFRFLSWLFIFSRSLSFFFSDQGGFVFVKAVNLLWDVWVTETITKTIAPKVHCLFGPPWNINEQSFTPRGKKRSRLLQLFQLTSHVRVSDFPLVRPFFCGFCFSLLHDFWLKILLKFSVAKKKKIVSKWRIWRTWNTLTKRPSFPLWDFSIFLLLSEINAITERVVSSDYRNRSERCDNVCWDSLEFCFN